MDCLLNSMEDYAKTLKDCDGLICTERKGEMQYFREGKAAIVIVALSLIVFAFMLLVTPNAITNVSAVGADGVGVYWDSDCTQEKEVFEIEWGNLTPGSVESRVVYIRNEVEEPVYLIMSTTNWYPENASKYITLKWDYTYRRIDHDDVLQIELILSVSRHIREISSFSFDILVFGSDRLPGDVNGDGIVDTGDKILVGLAFWSEPGDSNYNPNADVNGDGNIDTGDKILIMYYSCIWAGSTS